MELSATNFANQEDYLAFMRSEAFRGNVEGHAVDAQRYIAEVRAAVLRHSGHELELEVRVLGEPAPRLGGTR